MFSPRSKERGIKLPSQIEPLGFRASDEAGSAGDGRWGRGSTRLTVLTGSALQAICLTRSSSIAAPARGSLPRWRRGHGARVVTRSRR
jgi:hypothetical protein